MLISFHVFTQVFQCVGGSIFRNQILLQFCQKINWLIISICYLETIYVRIEVQKCVRFHFKGLWIICKAFFRHWPLLVCRPLDYNWLAHWFYHLFSLNQTHFEILKFLRFHIFFKTISMNSFGNIKMSKYKSTFPVDLTI